MLVKMEKIAYTNLELGLYLVIQEDKPNGYVSSNPFLVSVPDEIEGKIAYDVDASPKIDVYRKNSQTDKMIAYDVDASPKIDVYRKNSQTDKIIETTTVIRRNDSDTEFLNGFLHGKYFVYINRCITGGIWNYV